MFQQQHDSVEWVLENQQFFPITKGVIKLHQASSMIWIYSEDDVAGSLMVNTLLFTGLLYSIVPL